MNSNHDDMIDQPLGSDSDFSEFDQAEEKNRSLGDAVRNNPTVKIGLVVGAFIAIVGGIVLFGGSETKTPDSMVGGGSDLKSTPGTEELTPAMVDALEEENQRRTEEAQRNQESVIPIPIEPPKPELSLEQETNLAEDPLERWRRMQEEKMRLQQEPDPAASQAQAAADAAREQALANLAQAMSNQMSQILSSRQISSLKQLSITDPKFLEQQRQAQIQAQVAAAQAATAADPEFLNVLIPAGTIEYAQLLNEANSDVPGPVVAQIVTGRYAGSRILGSFQKQNDYLTLTFDTVIRDGISIPTDAIALDPNTTLPGMASEVDRKYFQRIILPAAAKFVEGMGSAIAESGSSTSVSVNDTTVVSDDNDPDTREELFKGVEEASGKLSELLDDEADGIEPLVRVYAGTPMGILFLQPVTDQDVTLGRQGRRRPEEEESNNSFIPSAIRSNPNTQALIQSISGDENNARNGNND